MAKRYLKTGVFGKTDEGDLFIVANDRLVYQDGMKDEVSNLNNDLVFDSGRTIVALYEATCFNEVERGDATLIWERGVKVEDKPTEPKTDSKTITITIDKFLETADKVNAEFLRVGDEVGKSKGVPGADMANVIMGLQNITFASLLADELFGEVKNDE